MTTIRLATLADLTTIDQLAREIWPGTYGAILEPAQLTYMLDKFYNYEVLSDQLLNQQHVFLMVEIDNKPVAFAGYSTIAPGISKLHKIYVHPSTQGQGIGKRLIDHIIATLQPQGFKALRLNVNRFNKARFFYEKLGFTIIYEEEIDIGSGYFMVDYVMEKPIS